MALYVGLDVSLRMRSICVVEADGSSVWEGKAESEPVPLVKVLSPWRDKTALVGIEACPLSEWLYGALVASGFQIVCIETRHASASCPLVPTRPTAAMRAAGSRRHHGQARR
jgi:transposase